MGWGDGDRRRPEQLGRRECKELGGLGRGLGAAGEGKSQHPTG